MPAHHSAEGASDPCVTYVPADGRPFRIQLKLSRSKAAALINVRSRQDTAVEKAQFRAATRVPPCR